MSHISFSIAKASSPAVGFGAKKGQKKGKKEHTHLTTNPPVHCLYIAKRKTKGNIISIMYISCATSVEERYIKTVSFVGCINCNNVRIPLNKLKGEMLQLTT